MIEVERKLKIGTSCHFMNISALLEIHKKLYMAFEYTNFDFIYNKSSFLKFNNPKSSEEYISKENELIISSDIDSVYLSDYINGITTSMSQKAKFETKVICSNNDVNLQYLKEKYLDKDIYLFIPCDHYYLFDEYKIITSNMLKFHTKEHTIILVNIDFDENSAYIVDKFYSFLGTVSLDNLKKSMFSKYRESFECMKLKSDLSTEENKSNIFKDYFCKNIELLKNNEEYINGNLYKKNIEALENFINDFEDNIKRLAELKGKYAPQFFSKLLFRVRLQRTSYYNLISYFKEEFSEVNREKLVFLAKESSEMWIKIDIYNDKIYLSGKTLMDSISKYKTLLNNLYSIEVEMIRLLKEEAAIFSIKTYMG